MNTVDFAVGETHPGSEFNLAPALFQAPKQLPMGLFIKLGGGSQQQIGLTAPIACVAASNAVRTFSDGDATYRVEFEVLVDQI